LIACNAGSIARPIVFRPSGQGGACRWRLIESCTWRKERWLAAGFARWRYRKQKGQEPPHVDGRNHCQPLARIFHTQTAGLGNPACSGAARGFVGRVPPRGGVSPFQTEGEISRLGPVHEDILNQSRPHASFATLGRTTGTADCASRMPRDPRTSHVRPKMRMHRTLFGPFAQLLKVWASDDRSARSNRPRSEKRKRRFRALVTLQQIWYESSNIRKAIPVMCVRWS